MDRKTDSALSGSAYLFGSAPFGCALCGTALSESPLSAIFFLVSPFFLCKPFSGYTIAGSGSGPSWGLLFWSLLFWSPLFLSLLFWSLLFLSLLFLSLLFLGLIGAKLLFLYFIHFFFIPGDTLQ